MLLQYTVCDNIALTFHSILFHFYGMILLFYSARCMIRLMMMREILEQITAGSPMVGTSINLVQRPINLGLIKGLSCYYYLKTFEMVKEQKKRWRCPELTQGLWLIMPVQCHFATAPTSNHLEQATQGQE